MKMYLLSCKPCLSRCLSTLCLLILIEQSLRSRAAGVARTKRGTRTVWKHHHENLVIINNPTNCYCIARWEAIPRKINNLNTQLADGTASVCALALFTVGSWEKKNQIKKNKYDRNTELVTELGLLGCRITDCWDVQLMTPRELESAGKRHF